MMQEDNNSILVETIVNEQKKKIIKKRVNHECLLKYYTEDINIIEIATDEVGRGPLFGRVYAAAVILPKDGDFIHLLMKDSKKFTSQKKIQEVSDYIKENAIAWHIHYEDEKTIDNINILQASQQAMRVCIIKLIQKVSDSFTNANEKLPIKLLIDGDYFNPLLFFNKSSQKMENINFECIKGGDNKYSSIAAASIIAKVARDKYIKDLCVEYPYLIERYSLDSNKGYGSKKHIDGIKKYGITEWHRKTFGICKSTFIKVDKVDK